MSNAAGPPQHYFYLCSYPLELGSIIQPGNWGRIMRLYPMNNAAQHWLPLREIVFESVRLRHYQQRPSRFDSLFLCESLQDLAAFKGVSQRGLDIAYDVEIVNPSAPFHRACMALVDNVVTQRGTLADLEQLALQYWQGQNVQKPEVITTSGVRILARH